MFKKHPFYIVFFILFSLLLAYSVYDYNHYKKNRNIQAIEKGENIRDEVKDVLNTVLDTIQIATNNLAEKLSKRKYSKKEIERIIKQTAIKNDFCVGANASFEPVYINDSTKQLYSPYYSKKQDKIEYVEDSYDYTDNSNASADWYTKVIQQQKDIWSNPFVGGVAKELIIDYVVPFYQTDRSGKKKIAGTVSLTVSASYITSYLHDITLGKTGYAIINNENKYFISHPKTEYLTNPEAAKDVFKKQSKFQDLFENDKGYLTAFSNVSQESAEFYYTRLINDWILTIVIPQHDLLKSSNEIVKKLIHISIFLTLSLITLLIILLKVWKGETKNLWLFSFFLGLLLFLNIVFIWYLNVSEEFYANDANDTKILSSTTIDNYLEDRNKRLSLLDSSLKSIEIPTGVFLYDIDFVNAYDVAIIGKIWQKIPDDFEVKNGTTFIFPQASATGLSVRVRPMSKEHIGNYWIYNYDFNATIQFDFDYLKFPLNSKKLDLQITYPHINDNIVLVPDIQSYEFINPIFKPGISYDLYMPNSKVIESYFSFHEHNFYSDLGNKKIKGLKETAVLTFNVLIKNVIISSIISNIIPILIIAIMIFLLPFTVDKKDGEVKEGGSLSIIQAAGGFFFVLLLAHIQLRKNIETPGLIYLEIFYFVMYFILAAMSASVMVYLKTNKYPILEYKQNLIFKISYWPILLFIIYLITLFIFY